MSCVVTKSNHSLLDIAYRSVGEGEAEVVRWCEHCGAIVIDFDVDGRVMPGDRMKMKFPQLALRAAKGAKP